MRHEDIRLYLRLAGWVQQSVAAVESDLDRWIRRLRARGISAIPPLGCVSCSPSEARAHNELNLLMLQAASKRDASLEHPMRNLTGVRPPKP
jgi:hypothetical protein